MPAIAPISTDAILGRWSVSRVILDRCGMGWMHFDGIADIDPVKFDEQGEMRIAGQRSQGRRTYHLRFGEGHVIVQFPDGREFIRLDGRPVQHVHHLCGDDAYKGRLFFLSPDQWGEVWHVTGPRKDYKSVSRYTRV